MWGEPQRQGRNPRERSSFLKHFTRASHNLFLNSRFFPAHTDVIGKLGNALLNEWFNLLCKKEEWIDHVNMGK